MILVFGKTGQVATALGQDARTTCLGRDQADLTDPAACVAAIKAAAPKAIINAAAYTAVDKAEEEEDLALAINGTTPGAMAVAAAELGVPFVHISTDYVFDGSGMSPFLPDAATAPLGAYGRTKLAGEEAVRAAGGPHAILRTSWVFSGTGQNFVNTMLRLGAERDELRIVDDQIGGPTYAPDIAKACLTIAEALAKDSEKSGTYHFSGWDDLSWAAFAKAIFNEAGLTCAIDRIPSEDYPLPAPRPLNSRLDCTSTHEAFGIERPNWVSGLRNILVERL